MLLKDRKQKIKPTKYRLAQQPKNKLLNKTKTLGTYLFLRIFIQNIHPFISTRKKSHSKDQGHNCPNSPGDMNVLNSDLSYRVPEYRSRINHNTFMTDYLM